MDEGPVASDKYETTVLLGLAAIYQNQQKFSQALTLHRHALRVWQDTAGRDDLGIVPTLANLAGLLYRIRRYSEAEHSFRRALALQENSLGRSHTDVATTLNNLAAVYQAMARYREAEDLYQEALNIRQIALGLEHPDVAKIFNNLGVLRAEQGRYREAEQLYRRAVAILESETAPNGPSLATALSNLAEILVVDGRYPAAEQLNLAALSTWEKSAGPGEPGLLTCLIRQALILRKLKRKPEAAAFQKRAAVIRAKYGSDASSYGIDISLLQVTGKKTNRIRRLTPVRTSAIFPTYCCFSNMRDKRIQAEHRKLSRRERQVMDIVYARERATAAEIHDALADRPSFSATRAVIRTLEEKGHLRHEEQGLRYVYLPVVPLDQAKRSALAHLVTTFFQGSPSQLLATLLDTPKVSEQELVRLEDLVRKAKREKK